MKNGEVRGEAPPNQGMVRGEPALRRENTTH